MTDKEKLALANERINQEINTHRKQRDEAYSYSECYYEEGFMEGLTQAYDIVREVFGAWNKV